MHMRWIDNLSDLNDKCISDTFVCDFDEKMAQVKIEYYIDQYLYYKDEFSEEETKEIENQILVVGDTISKTYPTIKSILVDFENKIKDK